MSWAASSESTNVSYFSKLLSANAVCYDQANFPFLRSNDTSIRSKCCPSYPFFFFITVYGIVISYFMYMTSWSCSRQWGIAWCCARRCGVVEFPHVFGVAHFSFGRARRRNRGFTHCLLCPLRFLLLFCWFIRGSNGLAHVISANVHRLLFDSILEYPPPLPFFFGQFHAGIAFTFSPFLKPSFNNVPPLLAPIAAVRAFWWGCEAKNQLCYASGRESVHARAHFWLSNFSIVT